MKLLAVVFAVFVMVLAFSAVVPWLPALIMIIGLGFIMHLGASRLDRKSVV